MQVIVMTSDAKKYTECIEPFMYLWHKHFTEIGIEVDIDVSGLDKVFCGFTKPDIDFNKYGWRWYSIGESKDYPVNKWSDAFLRVLETVAKPQFMLMLEDYWLTRDVDVRGILNMFSYAKDYPYLLKADVTTDRLNANPEFIEDYGKLGNLDLIRSKPGVAYQMSLWGGIWNKGLMEQFIIPGETAQEIEMNGTTRVNEQGSDVLVIGTKQAPLIHGNIYWSKFKDEPQYADPFGTPINWEVNSILLQEMRSKGIWGK